MLTSAVRLRYASAPLERDEGEYAYAGSLILSGSPPYQDAYSMKFPGIYYAYSLLLLLFGPTAHGIRLGLLVVNAATALLLFAIGRRLLGRFEGTVAAVSFLFLSLDVGILGIFAHATHFVLLPVLGGLLLLLGSRERVRGWELFCGGALLGVAVLMKQHAAAFLPLGLAVGLGAGASGWPRSLRTVGTRIVWILGGFALPLLLLAGVFLQQGVLSKFLFWTFRYARAYVSEVPLSGASLTLRIGLGTVTHATLLFWILAAAGLVLLWIRPWSTRVRLIISGLLCAGILATCPGFYFREHYFILLLPALALLIGVAFRSGEQWAAGVASSGIARFTAIALFAAVVGIYMHRESAYLFSTSQREMTRARFLMNPFPEAPAIAKYIRDRSRPEDRIAVLGSEPEIYFYADRRSATGYLYTYPLMEPQKYASSMQAEMIREIESAQPKFLVYVKIQTSWLPLVSSDRTIFRWADRFIADHYDLVGIADIYSFWDTRILWDDAARGSTPLSGNLVLTYRRRSDAAADE